MVRASRCKLTPAPSQPLTCSRVALSQSCNIGQRCRDDQQLCFHARRVPDAYVAFPVRLTSDVRLPLTIARSARQPQPYPSTITSASTFSSSTSRRGGRE